MGVFDGAGCAGEVKDLGVHVPILFFMAASEGLKSHNAQISTSKYNIEYSILYITHMLVRLIRT